MDIVPYIKACYPVLYVVTPEEGRAEEHICKAAQELKRPIKIWSHTEGFSVVTFSKDGSPVSQQSQQTEDPVDALNAIKSDKPGTIIVMRDLHMFLTIPKTIRQVRDIARDFKQSSRTLIITGPVKKLPCELERDVTVLELDLPNYGEIESVFGRLYEQNKKIFGDIDADERERIIQSAMGLTTIEAESAFAKAIVDHGKKPIKTGDVSGLVMKEKANAVKKSGILEYFEAKQTIDDMGGLDNLKDWLKMRSKAFSKAAREFGLPMPRGIVLVGTPGCGKSLSARVASNIFGVPLLRFDVGRVFGSLVGESEAGMRLAIQTAEAVGNSILWIDELDKAFAGMGGSGTTDGGTSQRVFGTFLTWMQEKTVPCFIVATVNRIDALPPELLRKGRFDEMFFIGPPNPEERKQILEIHIRKYGRKPENFKAAIKECVAESEGFSGAELEEAIISGLYAAFAQGKELDGDDILKAIRATNPLSKSKARDLDLMVSWAKDNAVNASRALKKTEQIGRQLEV